VRVGMEATGFARWFERLLAELGFELWIGDPAEIKTRRVKKQKTDRKDAELLLKLMREDRFPRIWIPSPENRDLRQLLWHRHRLVQMRRHELWDLLDRLNPTIEELTAAAEQEAKKWPDVATDDASRRGPANRTRLCVDHRNSVAVRSWQADWQIRGNDSE